MKFVKLNWRIFYETIQTSIERPPPEDLELVSKGVSKLVRGQTSPHPSLVVGVKRVSVLRSAKQLRPLPTIRSPKSLGEGVVLHDSVRNVGEVKNTSCASTVKNLLPYRLNALLPSKKAAFTLVEVLITLAIIGIVAAMTMPTLIQNHQKRSLEVATQKFYSMMSQAVKQYMADEGVDDLRNTPLTDMTEDYSGKDAAQEAVENFVKKYLKVVQVCEDDCFADTYKTQTNEISEYIGTKSAYQSRMGKFVISDGMVLNIISANMDYPIILYVDVNGKKGPNKIGYDLWSMEIFYDGSIDESDLTPECKKGINNLSGNKLFCGWSNSNSTEARQIRFEGCQDGINAYGGCFGHFLENNFKFDY